MKLTCYPFALRFKYPFRIAHGTREQTSVVFVRLQQGRLAAWGEAALPPYLAETTRSVTDFLHRFTVENNTRTLREWRTALQSVNYCMPGKAALDMALWQLYAKTNNASLTEVLGITPLKFPQATYTIGVSSPQEMQQKIKEAKRFGFRLLKIKLDGKEDEAAIKTLRNLSGLPFAIDANQAWGSQNKILQKIEWLQQQGCVWIEQPLPVALNHKMPDLKKKSALPIYADESCQRKKDLGGIAEGFHGVNIKLMKCGGLTEARAMIDAARALHLNILIGCMSESSVGCTAAAALTPLADYADLDGPYLTANDPFTGMGVAQGRIALYPLRKVRRL